MSFSVAEFPQFFKIAWILLFSSVHIYLMIFKSGLLADNSFNMVKPSSAKQFCCTWSMAWIPVMLKNLTFIQVLCQIVLQQLDVFGTIQVIASLNKLSWILTYVSPKYQTLTPKLHCFLVMWVISLSWRPEKFSLISLQLHPSFIAEYDLISSNYIPT